MYALIGCLKAPNGLFKQTQAPLFILLRTLLPTRANKLLKNYYISCPEKTDKWRSFMQS